MGGLFIFLLFLPSKIYPFIINYFHTTELLTHIPSSQVSVSRIQSEVQTVVPTAQVSSSVAGEVIFTLPLSAVPQFPALFKRLDGVASEIGT